MLAIIMMINLKTSLKQETGRNYSMPEKGALVIIWYAQIVNQGQIGNQDNRLVQDAANPAEESNEPEFASWLHQPNLWQ